MNKKSSCFSKLRVHRPSSGMPRRAPYFGKFIFVALAAFFIFPVGGCKYYSTVAYDKFPFDPVPANVYLEAYGSVKTSETPAFLTSEDYTRWLEDKRNAIVMLGDKKWFLEAVYVDSLGLSCRAIPYQEYSKPKDDPLQRKSRRIKPDDFDADENFIPRIILFDVSQLRVGKDGYVTIPFEDITKVYVFEKNSGKSTGMAFVGVLAVIGGIFAIFLIAYASSPLVWI